MRDAEGEIIKRYILRELADPERQQFEERLMSDDDFFNLFLLSEDELIEEYVQGGMSVEEREKFEQTFLISPEGRRRLNFNVALDRYVSESSEAERASTSAVEPHPTSLKAFIAAFWIAHKPLAASAVAILVLLLSLSSWLAVRSWRLESQIERLRAEQPGTEEFQQRLRDAEAQVERLQKENRDTQEENERLKQQIARSNNEPKSAGDDGSIRGRIAQIMLLPGLNRSGSDEGKLRITSRTMTVELTLRVESAAGDYKSYSAELKERISRNTIENKTLRPKKRGLETQVIVQARADVFSQGDYVVTLFGITDTGLREKIDDYYFTVLRN